MNSVNGVFGVFRVVAWLDWIGGGVQICNANWRALIPVLCSSKLLFVYYYNKY
jgi:hypothetical protein